MKERELAEFTKSLYAQLNISEREDLNSANSKIEGVVKGSEKQKSEFALALYKKLFSKEL